MTFLSLTSARRGIWALSLMLGAATLAHADTPTPGGDSETHQLDVEIQQYKQQALDINRDALNAEEDYLYPIYTRLAVGVSVNVSGLLLHEVKLSLDGGQPVDYTFENTESIALLKSKGLDRLMRANAANGQHRLHAEFEASFADSKPNDPPLRGTLDQTFVKDDQTRMVEVIVGHGSPFGKPELSMKIWSAPK